MSKKGAKLNHLETDLDLSVQTLDMNSLSVSKGFLQTAIEISWLLQEPLVTTQEKKDLENLSQCERSFQGLSIREKFLEEVNNRLALNVKIEPVEGKIDLSNLGLSRIPKALMQKFVEKQYMISTIILSQNNLTHLPEELSSFPLLTKVDITHNRFSQKSIKEFPHILDFEFLVYPQKPEKMDDVPLKDDDDEDKQSKTFTQNFNRTTSDSSSSTSSPLTSLQSTRKKKNKKSDNCQMM